MSKKEEIQLETIVNKLNRLLHDKDFLETFTKGPLGFSLKITNYYGTNLHQIYYGDFELWNSENHLMYDNDDNFIVEKVVKLAFISLCNQINYTSKKIFTVE